MNEGNSVITRHEEMERYSQSGCNHCGCLREYQILECSESEEPCTKPCEFYINGQPFWWKILRFLFNRTPKDCEFLRLVDRCDNCGNKLQVHV